MADIILVTIVTLLSAFHAWRRHRYYLHVFQLEGYKNNEFNAWLRRQPLGSIILQRYVAAAIVILVVWTKPLLDASTITLGGLVAWGIIFSSARRYRTENVKKPLVFTARVKRLLVPVIGLALLFVFAGTAAWISDAEVAWYLLGWLAADMLAPRLVSMGGALMRPTERRVQDGFKQQARERLSQQRNTTIVGITGSYGKTSVKFAIAEVLRQQYNVLETPGSYNTPMGICKVINDQLENWHQYLILEMGARYVGDIKELCDIAAPDVAVLTSVGVAHLETMGSEEAIVQTKGELIEGMKPGGPVVANGDDANVLRLVSGATGPVTLVSATRSDADLFATDITYDTEGCHFRVVDRNGNEAQMHSLLLGRHNVTNILLALGVGYTVGLSLRQMKHAVSRLRPVAHRLQLRNDGDITVIDDAFNSNPVGARSAIEVLSRFQTGKRIIVTPGMVELGERQEEENRTLGGFMVGNVDVAILVGQRQTQPIHEGLLSAGFDEDKVSVVDSLRTAQLLLKEIVSPGDVVLYENDLPDHYDESG